MLTEDQGPGSHGERDGEEVFEWVKVLAGDCDRMSVFVMEFVNVPVKERLVE